MYGLTPLGSTPAEKTSKSAPPIRRENGLGDLAAGAVAGAHEEHPDRSLGHGTSLPSATGSTRGCDGGFEIDEFAIEAVEVIALAGDRCSLVGDQRCQVTVRLAALQAQSSHPTSVLGTESETPQADDQSETGEVLVGVLAISVGLPIGWWDHPGGLVPAHRRWSDTRARRQFRDLHGWNVHLQAARRSRHGQDDPVRAPTPVAARSLRAPSLQARIEVVRGPCDWLADGQKRLTLPILDDYGGATYLVDEGRAATAPRP